MFIYFIIYSFIHFQWINLFSLLFIYLFIVYYKKFEYQTIDNILFILKN